MKRNVDRTKLALAAAAFGLKAHSGWAALVVLARHDGGTRVLERSRLNLADENWAKQPYHAAENLERAAGIGLVKRGVHAAKHGALREVRAAVRRTLESGFRPMACGVLVGDPMPNWSVAEILAVHFRMHKAEGVLFRQVLTDAAKSCGLGLVQIPEKRLLEFVAEELETSVGALASEIAALGKQVGPPWGKDQKEAALAALIALGRTS